MIAGLVGIATLILVLVLFADLARENRFLVGAAFQRPLPCIDADLSRTSLSYHYSFPPTTIPSLLRIGPAPTPISLTYSAENEQSVYVFLYECLGSLRFLDLNKNSMTFREYSIPGSKLTYGCDLRSTRRQCHLDFDVSDSRHLSIRPQDTDATASFRSPDRESHFWL